MHAIFVTIRVNYLALKTIMVSNKLSTYIRIPITAIIGVLIAIATYVAIKEGW